MRKLLISLLFCAPFAIAQHNGTVVGIPQFTAAKFGNGLTSVDDSNYVQLPTGSFSMATSSSSWTIEAWLKTSSGVGVQVAISSGALADTNTIWLGSKGGNFAASVTGTGAFLGGPQLDSTISIHDGNWHHCVVEVAGGTTLKLFVDGVQGGGNFVGQVNNPPSDHTTGQLGRFAVANTLAWPGGIDEVTFWSVNEYSGNFTPPTQAYTGDEPNMYALYHLQSNGTDSIGNLISMNDPAIIYSPYNWNVSSSSAKTINSGAYFRTIFGGTSFGVNTDTSANLSPFSEFWVRIDNQGWVQFTIAAGNPSMTLASGLQNRKHLVEVIVKSTSETIARWSNSATMITFTQVILDQGNALSAPLRRTKNVIVYGDSITEGVRTTNDTATLDTDRNDVLGDYSYGLATALDAEVGVVGFGATGVTVSGSGGVPALTTSYNLIYSGVSRTFSPCPDVVVYLEGQNDGSNNITSGLTTVANAILGTCPHSKQLMLVPLSGTHSAQISAAALAVGANATAQSTSGWFDPADSSDGVHPYDYSHIGLIAPKLYPIMTGQLYQGTGRPFIVIN